MKSNLKRMLLTMIGVLSLLVSFDSVAFKTTTGLTMMAGSASEFRLEGGLSVNYGYHADNCGAGEVFVAYGTPNAVPFGLCVETAQRASSKYNAASATCMALGKRIMDYKEWRFACDGKTDGAAGTTRTGLESMPNANKWKWASSRPGASRDDTYYGASSVITGGGSCSAVGYGWVRSRSAGTENVGYFRCAR
jgi:hypothetical protein